jgi:hypothetical protein
VKRIVLGLALLVVGLGVLYTFREPVDVYTIQLAGSGDEAGLLVDAECSAGRAINRFAGDPRADAECALAEDDEETLRIIKLVGGAIVAIVGIYFVHAGYRVWFRDFRSGREYERMVRDHDLTSRSERRRR